jgi:hypothetical protein
MGRSKGDSDTVMSETARFKGRPLQIIRKFRSRNGIHRKLSYPSLSLCPWRCRETLEQSKLDPKATVPLT